MMPSSGQNGLSRFERRSVRLPLRISSAIGRPSPRGHIVADPEKDGRAKPALPRPLREGDLDGERRLDPAHASADARHARRLGER